MACAVQSMAPRLGQQQFDQSGKNCGVAGLPAAKEPDKPADQGAELEEGAGSPDTREDAGASSGESNTKTVEVHGQAARYQNTASEAADPSSNTGSGLSGKGEINEKAPGGEDGKPGKLPRPEGSTACPRCESMDTKFCYYNNYNVKQPRYFCKGCQRYWTAGGTLRNVPVGAGRRKNKSTAAKEAVREQARKTSSRDSLEPSFMTFPGLMDPALSAFGAGPMAPGKAGIPGFVPNLAVPGQLSPLAMSPYPVVDPAAASALHGCLATAFDGSIPQPSFAPGLAVSMSNRGSDLSEDGSHGGRRVRARPAESGNLPADSTLNGSTLNGSASTMTDMRTLANSGHGSTLNGSTLNGSGMSHRGPPESTHDHHNQLIRVPIDSNNGSSFQPFRSCSGSGNTNAFAQMPVSAGMQPDWISMAAAAGQQQAVAAQHQLQYQAAAMQAQAMQAAAANAAWNQGNNPYLSGLCFPYNLYSAAAPQQLYAAYASLAPQASPWGTMDGAAANNMAAPAMGNGEAGSNLNPAQTPTSQPCAASWGINNSGMGLGDVGSFQGQQQQQWMSNNGRSHSATQNGAREMPGTWHQWPTHSGELARTADNKGHASKGGKVGGMGFPSGLSGHGSMLSGSSNSSLTADLHNGVHRPAPSFNGSA